MTPGKATMPPQILQATHQGARNIELTFSDGATGIWNAVALLQRQGPLLVPLRDDQAFFERFFIDAGALCWPHGLELSPDPPCPPPSSPADPDRAKLARLYNCATERCLPSK